MAIVAAFASSDGVTVDQHFGRADTFVVYSISQEVSLRLEGRRVAPLKEGDLPEHHLQSRVDILKDCTLIIAQKFGRHAWGLFDPARTEILELDGQITDMLPQLQKLVKLRRKYQTSN